MFPLVIPFYICILCIKPERTIATTIARLYIHDSENELSIIAFFLEVTTFLLERRREGDCR